MRTLLGTVFLASLTWGAAIPRTEIQGTYVEARTADVYTAACHANSEVGLTGNLAVFGWKIDKGAWEGVKLDGLAAVGVIRAHSTLGDLNSPVYPVRAVLILDERANFEQRVALKSFAQKMGGDLLQDIVRIEYQPISITVANNDVHTAQATLQVGSLAEIRTRAIHSGDYLCHNEGVWYAPLTKVDHAMPAFTVAHNFRGKGLGATWSSPDKRSAFVASFHYEE